MTLVEVKTADLKGPALDWAVATIEGYTLTTDGISQLVKKGEKLLILGGKGAIGYSPSTRWDQGGPLIDKMGGFELKVWLESTPETKCEAHIHNYDGNWIVFGPTPLVAAMRCLVAAKRGDTVQIPSELIQ